MLWNKNKYSSCQTTIPTKPWFGDCREAYWDKAREKSVCARQFVEGREEMVV